LIFLLFFPQFFLEDCQAEKTFSNSLQQFPDHDGFNSAWSCIVVGDDLYRMFGKTFLIPGMGEWLLCIGPEIDTIDVEINTVTTQGSFCDIHGYLE
jgi:hypothetical protein